MVALPSTNPSMVVKISNSQTFSDTEKYMGLEIKFNDSAPAMDMTVYNSTKFCPSSKSLQ